jgi:uncharacterized protein YcbX
MAITIREIYRYPVKGLTPEARDDVEVQPGQAILGDRQYALALGSTPVEDQVGEWMPKSKFLMLMRNEKLAQLETVFDDATDTLTVLRGGRQVATGNLSDKIGRTLIEEFFSAFMGDEARGRPKVVQAAKGHALSDHAKPVVSIINAASLADMTRVFGKELNPLRFRGNLLFDGLDAWAEFDLVGKTLKSGDVTMKVFDRIDRCAATNVNPTTAERDQNIPKALMSAYGHIDCGVFAEVLTGGTLSRGDTLSEE